MKMENKQQPVEKSKIGSVLLLAQIAVLFVLSASTHAQPSKIWRIGFLVASSASSQVPRIEAFRRGLRDLGYIEGQNMIIELRSGEGKPDRLPIVAAELVQLKVDVIVTGGGASNRAAKATTSAIPIVMTQDDDPIGNGLVASLNFSPK
jgi:putative ABC transport system substrate-binding protein